MPKKTNKPALSVKKKAPARRVQPRQRRMGANKDVLDLARLINDPCGSPLVAPQYGASSGGYLTKLTRFDSIDMSVGGSGFVVWFPDYTGRTYSSGNGANIFVFQTAGSDQPVNTDALPLGAGSVGSDATNGWAISDPTFNFVSGSTVQDCRTVAACVKMTYTGRNDALAGRFGVIRGFSRDALLNGGGSQPPSIGEMFNYSTDIARTPMDPIEVKYSPGEGSEFYRNVANVEDLAFIHGTIGTTKTKIGAGTPGSVGTGIGLCWSGLDTTSTITLDFLKAIEWRPEFSTNLAAPNQTVSDSGSNLMSRAVAYLDRHYPGWHQTLTKAGASAMARMAQTAFTGPFNQIVRNAPLLLLG